ncbi:MAG TPA: hypothetical protein VMM36_00850 [Opitutaceae bacterium]|nr:hypothetical protein [Opitutaceae bacterium]
MSDEPKTEIPEQQLRDTLEGLEPTRRQRILRKVVMAALGSVPWVGGLLAATQAFREETGQLQTDLLQRQWLDEHRRKMKLLAQDITEILLRLESLGAEIESRLESEEYLDLVRKAFRAWDEADTQQKREHIKKLISNAGGMSMCPDDLVRLFLNWITSYDDAHFLVIKHIYRNPGATRYEIWEAIRGVFPREDSAEADLFRLLIGDLSLGRVIRQHRGVNYQGQFLARPTRTRAKSSGVLKSAFDDQEEYELTELGSQFVHYVFTDLVTRIDEQHG